MKLNFSDRGKSFERFWKNYFSIKKKISSCFVEERKYFSFRKLNMRNLFHKIS